jgi:hypothetical protein
MRKMEFAGLMRCFTLIFSRQVCQMTAGQQMGFS